VVLLYVGRLDRLKGCGLLIEALPAIRAGLGRAVHLIVAGDGPDRGRCEQMAGGIRVRDAIDVTFRSWVGADERSQLLADAEALVLPSVWPEPYGLSGLEALAAGVPVAAFRTGGIGEWLRDGTDGALADAPANAPALAAAVIRAVGIGRFAPAAADHLAGQQREHLRALVSSLEHVAGAPRAQPA
jgi:glycosyltransferase involved in cell wall biosynthesis